MALRSLSLSLSQPTATLKSDHRRSSDGRASVWDGLWRRAAGSAFCSLSTVLEGLLEGRRTAPQGGVILGAEILGAALGPAGSLGSVLGLCLVEACGVCLGFPSFLWGLLPSECLWELCEGVSGLEGSQASPFFLSDISSSFSIPSILLLPYLLLSCFSFPLLLFSVRPRTPCVAGKGFIDSGTSCHFYLKTGYYCISLPDLRLSILLPLGPERLGLQSCTTTLSAGPSTFK